MAVEAIPRIGLGVTETAAITGAGEIKVNLQAFDIASLTLNATSTPAVTKVSAASYTLSSGAATIDLTSLSGVGGTVDATGLKLQGMLFKNRAGNAPITITAGASNGYLLFGTSGSVVLSAHASRDGQLCILNPEGLPDVSGTAKTIDVAGTGSQVFDAVFLFG